MSDFEIEEIQIDFPNLKKLIEHNVLENKKFMIERSKQNHHWVAWTSIVTCIFGKSKARSNACKKLIKQHGFFIDISKGDSCIIFQDDVLKDLFKNEPKEQRFVTNKYIQALRFKTTHPFWTHYFHPGEYSAGFMDVHHNDIKDLIKDLFESSGAIDMSNYQLCDFATRLKEKTVSIISERYEITKAKRQRLD